MDRRNLRWGVLLVLWCVAGLKLAAMKVESLDHGWFFNRGYESQAAGKVTVDLPHTWNAADAMFGNVDYYRGMSNYSRFITIPSSENLSRVFLRVKAAQTVADVYLDNHFVAQHKGGYTSFTVELTPFIRKGKKQKLDIRVSNAQTMEIAPICGDFNTWGGLNRGVELLLTDEICIDPTFHGSSGVFFTPYDVSASHAKLEMKALLSGSEMAAGDCSVEFSLRDAENRMVLCKEIGVTGKEAIVKMELDKPHLWDGVNDPYLYTGVVVLKKGEKEIDRREEHKNISVSGFIRLTLIKVFS